MCDTFQLEKAMSVVEAMNNDSYMIDVSIFKPFYNAIQKKARELSVDTRKLSKQSVTT